MHLFNRAFQRQPDDRPDNDDRYDQYDDDNDQPRGRPMGDHGRHQVTTNMEFKMNRDCVNLGT